MKRSKRESWWGLYALIPVTAMLLYVSYRVRVGATLHAILLVAVAVVVAVLTLLWLGKHADLVASEGVDAQAEEDSLASAGITPGRLAPSLTARQAHYRRIMVAGRLTNPKTPPERFDQSM